MPIPLQIIHISLRGYLLGQLFYRKINIFHRKHASQQPYFENYRRVPLQNKNKIHQSNVKNMRNSKSLGLGVVTNVFPSQSVFSEQSIESTKNSFIHSFILIPNSDHLVLRCTEIIISKQIILYHMNTYTCTINICVRKNKLIGDHAEHVNVKYPPNSRPGNTFYLFYYIGAQLFCTRHNQFKKS